MSSQINNLSIKFNDLLTQYQNTYHNFLNEINSNNNNFTTIPNSAFISEYNFNTIESSNADNCLNSCSSTQNCSGATFDNNLKTCILSNGPGNLVNSNNQTAIVKNSIYYTNQLQNLNDQLLKINNSMLNHANSNINNYTKTEKENNSQFEILNKNYNILQQERIQLEEMLREYETLNTSLENGNISVTSNYYTYIFYLFIAILLIIILLKFNFSTHQQGGSSFIKLFNFFNY
jgi:exonuclease VII large subunit